MSKSINSIKEIFSHASTFLLHDLEEVAKLQNAPFADIDSFVEFLYKKVLSEIKYGFKKLYEYSEISISEKIPFRSYEENGLVSSEKIIRSDNAKSISEISKEMGISEFNNTNEISKIWINPISNIPSFIRGYGNVTIDVCVKSESKSGNSEIEDFYIYNPINVELMHYKKGEGVTVNNYRTKIKQATSIFSISCEVVLRKINDIAIMPKESRKYGYITFTQNISTAVVNYLSGKSDALILLNPNESDKYYIDLGMKNASVAIYSENGSVNQNIVYDLTNDYFSKALEMKNIILCSRKTASLFRA